jgi:hypothetical protein
VEIRVPEAYMGEVNRDLNGRRGRVLGMDTAGDMQVISAHVPLAEMSNYATELRSLAQGRGSFTISLDHYDDVPGHIAEKVIESHRKEIEAAGGHVPGHSPRRAAGPRARRCGRGRGAAAAIPWAGPGTRRVERRFVARTARSRPGVAPRANKQSRSPPACRLIAVSARNRRFGAPTPHPSAFSCAACKGLGILTDSDPPLVTVVAPTARSEPPGAGVNRARPRCEGMRRAVARASNVPGARCHDSRRGGPLARGPALGVVSVNGPGR